MKLEDKALEINKILAKKYPTPVSALKWHTPWQMMVAAILSAQTTDKSVNIVTEKMFAKYPNPQDIQNLSIEDLYQFTKSINYYRNKTKFIKDNADILLNDFYGIVPQNIEDLVKFKGIGRKVANVILGDVFNKPQGIVVDTHVKRVSFRLGLTKNTDPVKIEQDLMKIYPKELWVNISHRLIFHGREICIARKPKCEICPLKSFCIYYKSLNKS